MVEYMTGVDRCACCGAVIPEGGWICPNCRRFTVTAGGRRSGKTAHILNRAALTGAVVIVKDENRKTQLEEQAKRMGLSVRVETLPRWERATEIPKLSWLIADVIVREEAEDGEVD